MRSSITLYGNNEDDFTDILTSDESISFTIMINYISKLLGKLTKILLNVKIKNAVVRAAYTVNSMIFFLKTK